MEPQVQPAQFKAQCKLDKAGNKRITLYREKLNKHNRNGKENSNEQKTT